MEEKQALQIIKNVLDVAIKSGLFENLDASIMAANAYKTIEDQLKNKITLNHSEQK